MYELYGSWNNPDGDDDNKQLKKYQDGAIANVWGFYEQQGRFAAGSCMMENLGRKQSK